MLVPSVALEALDSTLEINLSGALGNFSMRCARGEFDTLPKLRDALDDLPASSQGTTPWLRRVYAHFVLESEASGKTPRDLGATARSQVPILVECLRKEIEGSLRRGNVYVYEEFDRDLTERASRLRTAIASAFPNSLEAPDAQIFSEFLTVVVTALRDVDCRFVTGDKKFLANAKSALKVKLIKDSNISKARLEYTGPIRCPVYAWGDATCSHLPRVKLSPRRLA